MAVFCVPDSLTTGLTLWLSEVFHAGDTLTPTYCDVFGVLWHVREPLHRVQTAILSVAAIRIVVLVVDVVVAAFRCSAAGPLAVFAQLR
jgi:hypothetical protein